jgi:bifunctional non-homologous end joining protein LigD
LTEDHPLDYLLFEGVIPEGNYGAGTVIVWDTGTYTTESDLSEQFDKGKIGVTLNGQKLKGRFYLVRTSTENQWLLFKKSDQFDSKEDLTISKPESVLTGRGNDQLATTAKRKQNSGEVNALYEAKNPKTTSTTHRVSLSQDFPINIKPMLATLVDKPFNNKDWVFEVKWDGIRSIFYVHKTKDIFKLESRNGIDITHRYPETIESLKQVVKYNESAIFDGEIVVLNKEGYPEFGSHKERMSVNSDREIRRLSKTIPATYYLFDILYYDGQDLRNRDYINRRKILSEILSGANNNRKRVRISDYIEEQGVAVFENIKKMNLEGIIAKRKNSKYIQGARSKDWLKVKNTKTQDCVVIGYTSGEGNREKYFGSLILAVYEQGRLRFAGHTGSGFNTKQLERVYNMIKSMRIGRPPIDRIPYLNGKPTWIKPQLVAEIKFDNWTNEKILRAPIFQRFREDKSPEDCTVQGQRHLEEVVPQRGREQELGITATTHTINQKPNPLLDSFSNLDKVFWDKTSEHPQLAKRDLIEYYDKVSKHILPHLKDRPLSLSRYPDGIKGKSFYHKNWNQARPDYVKTVKVYSETRGDIINYILGNNKETLLWIANLGCIEMHPWYSRVIDSDSCKNSDELNEDKCGLSFPDFVIFDLDPYIYSGNENKGEEPEYNVKGFKSVVEVAFSLKELFDELKIKSYIKTSGKTGLHIFVPVVRAYSYDQTRAFAEIVGKILMKRIPQKITTTWDITRRRGKVFFDFNQNAKGKTIASVFSARPSTSATVSMPVKWKDLDKILPSDFTMLNVSDILKRNADPWKDILSKGQDLARILNNLSSK